MLSVKIKPAKYQKMKQGKYLGGHVPYSLMKDPKDKHKLIVDPEAAAVVREIFDMAIAKMRIIDMARTLNERGVETPGQYYRRRHPGTKKFINSSDKACWTHANLRTILKQEMYYGTTYYSFEELKDAIERYIKYYNEKRIKEKLGWMSPVEYRLNTLAA